MVYDRFPHNAVHISTSAAAASAATITPGTKILLVVVAVLAATVAGLLVGVLHNGSLRESILRGLYAFGAVTLGLVMIEAFLGVL